MNINVMNLDHAGHRDQFIPFNNFQVQNIYLDVSTVQFIFISIVLCPMIRGCRDWYTAKIVVPSLSDRLPKLVLDGEIGFRTDNLINILALVLVSISILTITILVCFVIQFLKMNQVSDAEIAMYF